MRLLLVEDDAMIGESVRLGLRRDGFTVDWVQDGRAAELALANVASGAVYDLLLLDLGLPKKDGLEVLKSLRRNGNRMPVLVLTARDSIGDRIKGLDSGADDYLVKPFDLDELSARIRALLRRQAGRAESVIQCGELRLNPATREASYKGRQLTLSAREFALLEALLDRPGAVLSREQLEEKLYGWDEEIESNTVEVYIHGLRKKLGQDFIKNIRGVGYMVPKAAMTSMRRQLLIWLLAGLSVTTLAAAFAVYSRARVEAAELFDYQLQVMAAAFPNRGFGRATPPPDDEESGGPDVVVVQIWDQNGAQLYWSRPGSPILHRVDLGFSTVATPRGAWRVFNTIVGGNIVQVSQPMRARTALAAGMALRTMLPLLLLFPVLTALIWITVGRGLKPLNEVAAALGRRSEDALEPLPTGRVPREVQPLVAALNDLLARLGSALSLQKTFIADAAHELRTPLTAVRLQIQLAERAATGDERAAAFAQLKAGAERASRLVQQLLTLARSEPGAAERPLTPVDLTEIARQAVAEHAPIAEAKGVDLGLSAGAPAMATGDADALRTLLGNLIDNAVHYTPRAGVVDVAVTSADGEVCWTVTDTGPGIPVAERARVFDRFHRVDVAGATGSGLGLAIVQRVAQRHRAVVELVDGPDGRGLKVTVRFPKA